MNLFLLINCVTDTRIAATLLHSRYSVLRNKISYLYQKLKKAFRSFYLQAF